MKLKNEMLCWIINAVGLIILCQRSWTSCSDTWHHGFDQIPTDNKNQNLTACARNLITGHVWSFQEDSDPKTNIKIKTKMSKKPSICNGHPSP